MTPPLLALSLAEGLLVGRVHQLKERIAAGEDVWREFTDAANALAAVVAQLRPEATGQLLTTAEMASRLQVSAKTLRKKARRGVIAAPVRLAARGPGALRWRPAGVSPTPERSPGRASV